MGWQVVLAAGGPRERGRAYGAQAPARVRASIDLYRAVFAHYTGLTWSEIVRRAGAFVPTIEAYDVELIPEIEGIAEGAGVPAEDVLAINLRTELMYGLDRRPRRTADECTAIAAAPPATADDHVWLAQNWDWKPAASNTCVVLACAPAGRPGFVTVVEAGLLAKCGANDAGIAVGANALVSSRDRGEPGVPFHAILRRALTSSSAEEAVDAIALGPRASSANYLLGSADGSTVDIEAIPGGPDDLHARREPVLTHTNHFLWPRPRPFKDVGRVGSDDTLPRLARARRIGEAPVDLDSIREMLRDHERHPGSVCSHQASGYEPVENGRTIASMIVDLTEGTMWVTQGNPCTADYERLGVTDLIHDARHDRVVGPTIGRGEGAS